MPEQLLLGNNLLQMSLLLSMLLVAVQAATSQQGENAPFTGLHPAFICDGPQAAAMFQKGYEDADHYKDMFGQQKPYDRRNGNSWLIIDTTKLVAYYRGFSAKKKYLTSAEVADIREAFQKLVPPHEFDARGVLSTSTNYADSVVGADGKQVYTYKDVRVILKVGDRVYQPKQQPGDIVATFKSESSTQIVNDDSFGMENGKMVTYPGMKSVNKHDEWLEAPIIATFTLFDDEGAPRITPKDREFTVIVIVGAKQEKFKYKTDDFLKLEKMKSKG